MAKVYCVHCGTANPEGSAYCAQCGSRLHDPGQGVRAGSKPSNGKRWVIPLVVVLVLALAGGVFAIIHFGKEKELTEIDLVQGFDDRVLDLSGQDGEGSITGIDYDRIRENLAYNDQSYEAKEFIDSVEYRTDKDDVSNLTNGEKVKIIGEYDESRAEELGFKVRNGRSGTVETTIKIERLEAKDVTVREYVGDINRYYNNAPALSADTDYSIRYSLSNYYLSEEDIDGLSYEATQRLINYIYANNGYEFQTKDAKAYFESFDWYWDIPNKTRDQDVAKSRFSDVERANEKLLIKRRDALK